MATYNRDYGFYTPAGWGGILTAYAPGTAITGTGAADFGSAIDASGYLVSAGTFSLTAPVTKTTGASAWSKTAGQTYNLTIAGDTWNITLTDNEMHATTTTGLLSTDQLRYYLENNYVTVSAACRANTARDIILRTGSYFNSTCVSYSYNMAACGWPGSITITNAGSGYTNSPVASASVVGGFTNVPLVALTGTGTGATAIVTVVGNQVVQLSVINPGTGYAPGDTVSAPSLAGGSGFVGTVVDLEARIEIRSENQTVGNDADGNPLRGGDAKHGGVWMSSARCGNIWWPLRFKWITFYRDIPAPSSGQNFLEYYPGLLGWGPDAVECRFENTQTVPLTLRNIGYNCRGSTADSNHFENCQRGIQSSGGVFGTTFLVPSAITNNVFHHCSDFVTLSSTNLTITDNFGYATATKNLGDHPDGFQHLGVTTGLTAGSGYTAGTWANVPLISPGSSGVFATVTVAASGVVTRVTPSAWTTMPEGAIYVIDPSETRLGPGTGMTYTSGISVAAFGTFARNIIVRDNAFDAFNYDCQAIFFSDTRGPCFINGLDAYNNITLTTLANGFLLTRFGNSSTRRSTFLGQLDTTSTTGTKPQVSVKFDVPIGPVDMTSTIEADRVVTNALSNVTNITQAGGGDSTVLIPIANPVTLAQALAAYETMFPNYVSGENPGYTNPAAVKAALSPAILAKASGGALLPDGTYSGALFPDGSWNDGTVYGSSGPTSYTATSPSAGAPIGVPITITLQLNASAIADVTFTPGVAGVTGTFNPTSPVVLIGESFVLVELTATTAGTATVSFTNDRGITNPSALVFDISVPTPDPTTYTQSPSPTTQVLGNTIDIIYTLDLAATEEVTITPACTLVGTFTTASTVVIPIGKTTGVATFFASAPGVATFSATNNRGLTNPATTNATIVASSYGDLVVLKIEPLRT